MKTTTKKEIIFGAKRAGVTWLHKFNSPAKFEYAKASAKRLGLSLSQLFCGPCPPNVSKLPLVRKFTDEDKRASTLKIQITECDPFTRGCLERTVKYCGYESIEEYIRAAALNMLITDEDESILDPHTGEVIVQGYELEGHYIGCKVDKNAPKPPPGNFTRIPIPAGAIVESCA
jgi:hypothetical protein